MYSFSVYDLRNIIHESMKDMLVDNNGRYEVWYRGYNSKYGSKRGELYWLTDDISYARAYGNRVEEVIIDMNKLNLNRRKFTTSEIGRGTGVQKNKKGKGSYTRKKVINDNSSDGCFYFTKLYAQIKF